jgi:DNA-binding LacI/PurR family transcriptional regulator
MMLRARTPAEVEPAVRARLSGPGGPTAIVAGSQLFALEVLSAAASVGACIPKDLSFITYGDARWAQVWNPPIGVVRTDYKEYGRRCAALLFAVSGGEEIEPTVHHPAEFVARASTAPVIA